MSILEGWQKWMNRIVLISTIVIILCFGYLASYMLNAVDFDIIDMNTQKYVVGSCAATFFFGSYFMFIFMGIWRRE